MLRSPKLLKKNLTTIQIAKDKSETTHSHVSKQLSNLPKAPERMVYKFTVEKCQNESLGIGIVGGKGTKLQGIFIKSIKENTPCWNDGNLLVGDQIIMLNNHDLREVSHDEAVTFFRECKSKVEIVISRMVESSSNTSENRSVSPFHGRMYLSPSRSFSDEPSILEHKNIDSIS